MISRYTMTQSNRCEYKNIPIHGYYWFNADTTDDAIKILHENMDETTFILKVYDGKGYYPIYKAIKYKGGEIKVLANRSY